MWARRDQIQAYQFLRRRTVSAILVGDANHAESPSRLVVASLVTGTIVMVLLLAGFGIYGLLRPGASTKWQVEGAIIQEKESGARFVTDAAGALHPVLNYASARLIVGGSGELVRVSSKSLADATRGLTVGIPDAPDSLPSTSELVPSSWTSCSSVSGTAGPAEEPEVVAIIGDPPVSQASQVSLSDGKAVIVRSSETTYVLWDGLRFRVRGADPRPVLTSLGFAEVPIVDVADAWLRAIPVGPDLEPPDVPGRGEPSETVGVAAPRQGQVFVESVAGSDQELYFVLLEDGLAPISTVQARLLLGDPASARAYPRAQVVPRPITPAERAQADESSADLGESGYPSAAPDALRFPTDGDVALCATPAGFRDGVPYFTLTLGVQAPITSSTQAIAPVQAADSSALADYVLIDAGAGALVQSVPSEAVSDGPLYLVTDQGVRFPIPDAESRKALGYESVKASRVPQTLVELLPLGPALDQAAANQFVAQ